MKDKKVDDYIEKQKSPQKESEKIRIITVYPIGRQTLKNYKGKFKKV